jgi:hypothetical protein
MPINGLCGGGGRQRQRSANEEASTYEPDEHRREVWPKPHGACAPMTVLDRI